MLLARYWIELLLCARSVHRTIKIRHAYVWNVVINILCSVYELTQKFRFAIHNTSIWMCVRACASFSYFVFNLNRFSASALLYNVETCIPLGRVRERKKRETSIIFCCLVANRQEILKRCPFLDSWTNWNVYYQFYLCFIDVNHRQFQPDNHLFKAHTEKMRCHQLNCGGTHTRTHSHG